MLQKSSARKTFRNRLCVVLPLVGAGIPPILIAATVLRYGLNVPYWDEWALVGLLDKAHAGQLTFSDFWNQHNEHRPVLPRAVMLALAKATGWDIRYELAANVVVALCVLGMLALLIGRTVRAVAPSLTPWLILAASLTTFSVTQWQNWLWGWQLQIFMNALAAVVTVWALALWGARWPGPALAFLAAVAGALSFGGGLLLMPLVAFGLLIAPQWDHGTSRLKPLALTVAGSAGVAILYFNGFRYPGHHPSPFVLFSNPLSYLSYVLIYLGAGLGAESKLVSEVWGALGFVTFTWCGVWLWARSPGLRRPLLPWILLGLYGLLSGFMTGIGRVGLGVEQALSPRYITISSLFWVSCAVIGALALTRILADGAVPRSRALTVVAVTASLLTLAAVSYGASWIHGEAAVKGFNNGMRRGGECLLDYDRAPDECLRFLFPDVALVRKGAQRLESLSLGPFAQSKLEQLLSRYAVVSGPEPAGYIDDVAVPEVPAGQTPRSGDVVISGWGMDPFSRGPAVSVLVVVGGRVMGRASTGEQRIDVAQASGRSGLLNSGWRFRFGLFRLATGSHLVEAYALLDDQRRIVKLMGSRVIEVRK